MGRKFNDKEVKKTQPKLRDIKGVGVKTLMLLKDKGFTSVGDIISSSPEEISKIPGIGLAIAKKIIDGAKEL